MAKIESIKVNNPSVELSNAHWAYIAALLKAHCVSEKEIATIEFHYKSAFVHGFKHGVSHSLEKERHGALIVEQLLKG